MEVTLKLGKWIDAGKILGCLEVIIDRNMNVKSSSGEVSDGDEEQVIRNWRKDDLCHKVEKNSAKLYSSVLWKIELVNDEPGYSAEEISK